MNMKINIIAFMQSESYLIRMQTTTTMMAIIKMMLAAEPITPPIMAPVFPLSSTKRTQINTSITINIKDSFIKENHNLENIFCILYMKPSSKFSYT